MRSPHSKTDRGSALAKEVARMDHVSITVRDVDKSTEFYSKGLGLKLLRVSVVNPAPGIMYKNAYMHSGTFLLELITAKQTATGRKSPRDLQEIMRGSVGITHLGVRVQNLESAVERLKSAGGKLMCEAFEVSKETTKIAYVARRVDSRIRYARRPGTKPWRIAVFSDPDGIIVEIVER
jgi:catechol 2,3-dioxygenase-like lactoylglutathione lyase family enzyme